MKDIMKMGIILLLFCFISAFSLSLTNHFTSSAIELSRGGKDLENRKAVFPEADSFKAIEKSLLEKIKASDKTIVEVFKALKGKDIIGYVAKSTPNAFGGPMEVVVGFKSDGKIVGVRIGKHAETPGLGDKATQEDFYSQYENMDLNKKITVDKIDKGDNQILAISAATITSQSVTDGVNSIGKILKEVE